MSYRKLLFAILFLLAIDSYASVVTVSTHVHDMEFRDLARKWDEAIPLGKRSMVLNLAKRRTFAYVHRSQ